MLLRTLFNLGSLTHSACCEPVLEFAMNQILFSLVLASALDGATGRVVDAGRAGFSTYAPAAAARPTTIPDGNHGDNTRRFTSWRVL